MPRRSLSLAGKGVYFDGTWKMPRDDAKRLCESLGAKARGFLELLFVGALMAPQVIPSLDAIDGSLRVIMVGCAAPCDFGEAKQRAEAAGVGLFDLEGASIALLILLTHRQPVWSEDGLVRFAEEQQKRKQKANKELAALSAGDAAAPVLRRRTRGGTESATTAGTIEQPETEPRRRQPKKPRTKRT